MDFDWQTGVVLLAVLGALLYLLLRGRGKRSQSCGKSSCGCVKKK